MSPHDTLRRTLRAALVEIPAEQAESDGWPQRAMPAMLAELELAQPPEVAWFADAASPLYDKAPPGGWRYCFTATDPGKTTLAGIAYDDSPPRVYLRADMSLPRVIETLGHELWHVREFTRGDAVDEEAADTFGAAAAARFWRSIYR